MCSLLHQKDMILYWKYDIWRVAKIICRFLLPIVLSIFFKQFFILFLTEVALSSLRTKIKVLSQLLLPLSPLLTDCWLVPSGYFCIFRRIQHYNMLLLLICNNSGIKLSRQLFSNCEQSPPHNHTLFPHSLCLH